MKKFMMMHFGFEKPTDEIMQAWRDWFASIADCQIDQGGFMGGKEVSDEGVKDLGWGMDSITGFNVIKAESMEKALTLAKGCPYIKSIRVYEMREM